MKTLSDLINALATLALFLGGIVAMAWAFVHGEWTLFFAATAAVHSMEYHIDKHSDEE